MSFEFLTNDLSIHFDDVAGVLRVAHPDTAKCPRPLIEIKLETLKSMSFSEASQLLGERIILLVPTLRSTFSSYFAKD